MSKEELKHELNNKLNLLDESQLKMVEDFIQKINSHTSELDLKRYVEEILKERTELLQKLAQ